MQNKVNSIENIVNFVENKIKFYREYCVNLLEYQRLVKKQCIFFGGDFFFLRLTCTYRCPFSGW